jgi:hypothetical protein
MIQIILFVAACLIWQGIKNQLHGKKRPTVSLAGGEIHAVAMCGCDTVENKVVRPCSAHKAMLEAKGR